MPATQHREEDLALLTDAERAGLLDETLIEDGDLEPTEEQHESPFAPEPEPDPDLAIALGETPEETAAAAAAADDATAAETAAAAAAPAPDTQAAPAPTALAPVIIPPNRLAIEVAAAQEKKKAAAEALTAMDAQFDALDQQENDGDLTRAEWRAKMRELEKTRDELKSEIIRQEVTIDFTTRAVAASRDTWVNDTVPAFLDEHPQYAFGTAAYSMLNAVVSDLQKETGRPYDAAHLANAHRRIEAEARKMLKLPDADPAAKPVAPAAKRPAAPPTLSKIAAAAPEIIADNSKFAALDRLKGEAYQTAFDKLSPAEQDAYMAL
jgi:hypothetical protein